MLGKTIISPSILSADFMSLKDEIRALEEAGADMLHIDVMDGHFVSNITIGQVVLEKIKSITNLPLDVHLMISNTDHRAESFVEFSDFLTIHLESTVHLSRTIENIKKHGTNAGVSLLPTTHHNALDYIINEIDLVLVMSVNPGFGGQKFISSQINKITQVRKMSERVNISVDGGIDNNTIGLCAEAGANVFVSGSYVFSGSYAQNIKTLRTNAT